MVILIAAAVTYAFFASRPEWSAMHRYNRAFGDASLILVAMAMALGPLTRLTQWKPVRQALPYRREFGIYAVLVALIHAVIILIGWVELDLWRLFGFEFHPRLNRYVMVRHGFALANAVGILALVYGLVLALLSNDSSQRILGQSVWKFLQQGAYVLWWLIVLHTAYFLFVHFLDYHRRTPDPNWARWPFVALVLGITALQLLATLGTWQRQRSRSDAPQADAGQIRGQSQ
ncbi:ferric reductase-like transmembrane domain-containing protein [Pseudaestuariivita atlantica]|uniref:ferric reductase-like transmembrane domain-containing protein n=1 Tax=Pseudaestuariivita atlantica TaxID=1317121 RepID=UPI001F5EDFFB|nr:ferric reductase-like transmembrane domain-containing protein [Pseudaestuariivita atlantica]